MNFSKSASIISTLMLSLTFGHNSVLGNTTPVAQAQESPKNRAMPNVAEVSKFKAAYATKPMDLKFWNEQYPSPFTSWFGDTEEIANNWFFFIGPVGLRVRGHDVTWGDMKAFKALYPKYLCDSEGNLLFNALEVLSVVPGSPAEGMFKPGDILLGMEGEMFKTAQALNPRQGKLQYQSSRGLEMHTGMLLDQAEGKGEVSFIVLDPSKIKDMPPLKSDIERIEMSKTATDEQKKSGIPFDVPVKGGESVSLIVSDGGNGNGSDGFNWKDLTLVSKSSDKVVKLTDSDAMAYKVGYGSAQYDAKTQEWQAHAPSKITFDIPDGEWELKGIGLIRPGASIESYVEKTKIVNLPDEIKRASKKVSVKIPKLGTFKQGVLPKYCQKSQTLVEMASHWLAAQQQEDGSWPRHWGYTRNHYDTAMAGLGLMATNNPVFDKNIKKAAEYIATSGTRDWWGVPCSLATIFLCEYYLKYNDASVLRAISNNVNRLINEDLYGDYSSGHGTHPGYAGGGVSIGGSHMSLALALAAKTPVQFDKSVLDKMLIRAQELAPSGYVPYGRTTENFSTEPALQVGGTYSGRHGPYLIASLIHGGPEHFTKNCRAMYEVGAIGGADQGHSTETLSLKWLFMTAATISDEALQRHVESLHWKANLLRTHLGAYTFNGCRLEYQGAESLYNIYMRTAAWLIAFCGDRHALACTGNPKYKAKEFMKVPAISEKDVRFLGHYKRSWAFANAVLGDKAPESLKSGHKFINSIKDDTSARSVLFNFLKKESMTVAKEIMALQGVDKMNQVYCAEMVLGLDTNIDFEKARKDDQDIPGKYNVKVSVSEPLFGRSTFSQDAEAKEKAKKAGFPFSASVQIENPGNKFSGIESLEIKEGEFGNDWNRFEKSMEVSGPELGEEVLKSNAHIKYKVGDLTIEYDRPIVINEPEVGGGEKARKITNDRRVWVRGKLLHDHGFWGLSFIMNDGTYISTATQGNDVQVTDGDKKWVSSVTRSIPKGSICDFYCSTGWYAQEARVAELKLIKKGAKEVELKNLFLNKKPGDMAKLTDSDTKTFQEVEGEGNIIFDVVLDKRSNVRAIDLRVADCPHYKLVVEAEAGTNKWVPIYWTSLDNGFREFMSFDPVSTSKLRIKLETTEGGNRKFKVTEFRVYEEDQSK